MSDWVEEARQFQQSMAVQLGNRKWDILDISETCEKNNLGRKIGYSLYGEPTIDADDGKNSSSFGYDSDKEKRIKKFSEKIIELNKDHPNSNKIYVAFVFVWCHYDTDDQKTVLLRTLKCTKNKSDLVYFVDTDLRVYDGWSDYVKKNQLPMCHICYPKNGWYNLDGNNDVELEFRTSAECGGARKFFKKVDAGASVFGMAGTGVAVVGLFTPLAPLVATTLTVSTVSTAAYGTLRAGFKLFDKGTHGESINPLHDLGTFCTWLTVTTSVFSAATVAAPKALTQMAQAGMNVNKSGTVASTLPTLLTFSNLGLSGVGIGTSIVGLRKKINQEGIKSVTPLEWFQLSASILFFSNSVKNASTIIEDMRKQMNQENDNHLKSSEVPKENPNKIAIYKIDANANEAPGNAGEGLVRGSEQNIHQPEAANIIESILPQNAAHESVPKSVPMEGTNQESVGATNQVSVGSTGEMSMKVAACVPVGAKSQGPVEGDAGRDTIHNRRPNQIARHNKYVIINARNEIIPGLKFMEGLNLGAEWNSDQMREGSSTCSHGMGMSQGPMEGDVGIRLVRSRRPNIHQPEASNNNDPMLPKNAPHGSEPKSAPMEGANLGTQGNLNQMPRVIASHAQVAATSQGPIESDAGRGSMHNREPNRIAPKNNIPMLPKNAPHGSVPKLAPMKDTNLGAMKNTNQGAGGAMNKGSTMIADQGTGKGYVPSYQYTPPLCPAVAKESADASPRKRRKSKVD